MTSGGGTANRDGAALIVAGGDRPPDFLYEMVDDLVGPIDLVVAADSGADHLVAAGRPCDLIIGDLDSIAADTLSRMRREGVAVEVHPPEKDKTDLELALDAVDDRLLAGVTVVGLTGGRLDHELANLQVLCRPAYASLTITALAGSALVTVIRGQRSLQGRAGELVSLLPLVGDAIGVTTSGLNYPLVKEVVRAGSTRSISNRFTGERAVVEVADGVLLAVQPEAIAF